MLYDVISTPHVNIKLTLVSPFEFINCIERTTTWAKIYKDTQKKKVIKKMKINVSTFLIIVHTNSESWSEKINDSVL